MNTTMTGTMTSEYGSAGGLTFRGEGFERRLCRALAAKGITGRLDLHDAATRALRLSFKDLVKAGSMAWTEEDKGGLRLRPFKGFPKEMDRAA